jgi:hypothetical protein
MQTEFVQEGEDRVLEVRLTEKAPAEDTSNFDAFMAEFAELSRQSVFTLENFVPIMDDLAPALDEQATTDAAVVSESNNADNTEAVVSEEAQMIETKQTTLRKVANKQTAMLAN